MLDRDGNVFAWRGDQFGGVIDPDTASPHLVTPSWRPRTGGSTGIGRQPARHRRGDPDQPARGARPAGGHGGSTITQQVAKLMCLGVPYDPELWETETAYEQDCRRTTLWRKIQEVPFAFAMELRYSKDEILSIYLNRAYLGAGARGFEAAAQRYFGIVRRRARSGAAAMLAGLLVAPSYYAPTRNLDRAQRRAAT
jgi:penicillin-binding protein 1A